MTKTEQRTIRNIVEQLKKPNCGCHNGFSSEELVQAINAKGIEAVGRLYLDTWIIPALEMLLPENRNPKLAEELSR